MFCPYCATETIQGLNYCNRCGGNLAPLTQPAQESRIVVASGATWAAGLTTMGVIVIGLGMILPITGELTLRGMMPGVVAAIALFVALAVVACTAMLLRFWSTLLGAGAARHSAPAAAALPTHKAHDTRGLDEARFDSLNPAAFPSVTEQTTRTLEHETVNRKP
jgi:hypothetical protein